MIMNKDKVKIEGHRGSWYVVDEVEYDGATYFLLEHNTYGNDAPWVAVDEDGNLVMEDITDGREELIDHLTPYVQVKFFMNGDTAGTLYTVNFDSDEEYTNWYDQMNRSVEIFSEKFSQ